MDDSLKAIAENRSARPALWHVIALAVVLIVGVATRFYKLDVAPPGLYYDEAFYALDAVSVRHGAQPIYFEANNGREPLFIYSVALSQSLLGDTVLAVRIIAAIYGSLALLSGYGAARALFGGRVALFATALQATSLWAIQFSRIGLRATTVPFVFGLLLLTLAYGWRTRRRGLLMLGGALLGLCFYTYIAARLIPLVFIALGFVWWIFKRETFPRWDWIIVVIVPAVVVAAPMMLYAATHIDLYFGRAGQVAIPIDAVIANVPRVVAMFFWHGDDNWRHNLSGRPVFDPVTALAFAAGLAWLAWRLWKTRDLRAALVLIWLVVFSLPTIFSDRAPHFLRAIGLMPVVFLPAAFALERVAKGWGSGISGRQTADGRRQRVSLMTGAFRRLPSAVCGLVILVHAAATFQAEQAYAASEAPRFAFETAAVELAEAAQTCVETGAAWIDSRMWERFPSIRYLAPQTRPVDVATLPGVDARGVCLFTTAGEAPLPVVAHWPSPVRLMVASGGLDQTEGTPAPYPLYNIFHFAPLLPLEPIATFVNGPRLLLADVTARPDGLGVHLVWAAEEPLPAGLHIFIHWRAGDQMLAQWDGPLGGELLPAEVWRVGDQVEQSLVLAGAASADSAVWVGVYDFGSRDRLLTETGDDHVTIRP